MSNPTQTQTEPNPQNILDTVANRLPQKYYWQATLKLFANLYYVQKKWRQAYAFNKKSFSAVLSDMFKLIWKYHGITVVFHGTKVFIDEYFSERLHEKDHSVTEYMLEREASHIFWVSSSHDIAKIRQIDNKTSGYDFLQKNNLPTTTRYGVLKRENQNIIWETSQGDHRSLDNLLNTYQRVFIKPDNDGVGRGCAVLAKGKNGAIILNDKIINEDDFACHINRPLLVEEIVTQIPECEIWHPESLNTLRLITMRNPQTREIYVERAIFRMGVGNAHTDNWCTGGIGVKVFPNGKLDKYGYYCDSTKAPDTEHPDSGKQFEGFKLSSYNEATKLVLKAHQLLKRINGIGWDIAFTERGPIIIEMNPFFSVFQAQCGGLRKLIEEHYLPQAKKNCARWKDLTNLLSQHD